MVPPFGLSVYLNIASRNSGYPKPPAVTKQLGSAFLATSYVILNSLIYSNMVPYQCVKIFLSGGSFVQFATLL